MPSHLIQSLRNFVKAHIFHHSLEFPVSHIPTTSGSFVLGIFETSSSTHAQLLDDPATGAKIPGGPDPGEGDAEGGLRARGLALEVELRRVVQEDRGEAVRVEDRGEVHHVGSPKISK